MTPPRKVSRRAAAVPPKAPRRRAATRAIGGPWAVEGAPSSGVEPWAVEGVEPEHAALVESVEAVSEAESPRESEQAVGLVGRADPEAGVPADGESPPHLEER